jgi:hypothetical protein
VAGLYVMLNLFQHLSAIGSYFIDIMNVFQHLLALLADPETSSG